MIHPSEAIHTGTTSQEKTSRVSVAAMFSSTVQHRAVVRLPLRQPDAGVKSFLRVHSSILVG